MRRLRELNMVYSEFELADLPAKLGVKVADHPDLFPGIVSTIIET
jgi:hypothetical protein